MSGIEKNSIDKLQDEIRDKRDKQLGGLRMAFETSFGQYFKNHGEYPNLNTDKDVNFYLEGHTELKTAVFKLDLVLPEVAKVALEVLAELKGAK